MFNDLRGLAPKGWPIPSHKDLTRFLFSQQSIGISFEDKFFQEESNSLQLVVEQHPF
ncbi:hypothetical protein [Psychroflexus salis]|uniref:hypothetical protein n=1 Tax=Psychroflexus salis TaxID=1526574 RepID=UPI001662C01E|nr:hypothetical protein [Psychroflexus salis]